MLNEELKTLLQANKLFEEVALEGVQGLDQQLFQQKEYKAGERIIEQDSTMTDIFLITGGTVEVSKTMPDGREIKICTRHHNEFVGELSLIGEGPRSASVTCVTPVQALIVHKDDFFSILESIPSLNHKLAQIIALRLRESDERTTSEINKYNTLLELNRQISNQKKELEKTTEQLIQSEVNLKQALATKDKFFSIIAHDLRSPFQSFFGYSDYVQQFYDTLSAEEIKDTINRINKLAKYLYTLLENLLDWASVQTGRLTYFPEQIKLSEVVQHALYLMKNSAAYKEIELTTQFTDHDSVFADEKMIQTVMRNLVSNAIKFTPHRGHIKIILENMEDTLKVSVIDTGIGIQQEDIPKLFRLDVHHSSKGTRQEEGSGLGLILCKEFIEINGGEIWIVSKPDHGSCFSFTLPTQAPP